MAPRDQEQYGGSHWKQRPEVGARGGVGYQPQGGAEKDQATGPSERHGATAAGGPAARAPGPAAPGGQLAGPAEGA